jgi:hypothetical protein
LFVVFLSKYFLHYSLLNSHLVKQPLQERTCVIAFLI